MAVDNTFATETFPDDISSKSPEVFKKCYNVEPYDQTSFPTLDDREHLFALCCNELLFNYLGK